MYTNPVKGEYSEAAEWRSSIPPGIQELALEANEGHEAALKLGKDKDQRIALAEWPAGQGLEKR